MNNQQHGFTLIELLLASVLGALLIAGIAGVFAQSSRSFSKQQALSFMVDDGRYALEIFSQELRRAGYLADPRRADAQYSKSGLFAATATANDPYTGLSFGANASIVGEVSNDGFAGNPHDINHFVLRYQLNPAGQCSGGGGLGERILVKAECMASGYSWTDNPNQGQDAGNSPCSGQVADTNGLKIADIKTIAFFVGGANNTLFCYPQALDQTYDSVTDTTSYTVVNDNGGASFPLIDNVEKLFVNYGVDTDGDRIANQYVPADFVGDWTSVVSARFYLVLMTEQRGIATTSNAANYIVNGVNHPAIGTEASQGRLYRVFTTTIAFRN